GRARVAGPPVWRRDDLLDRDEQAVAGTCALDRDWPGDRVHAADARDCVLERGVDDTLVGDRAAMRVARLDPEALARRDLELGRQRAVEGVVKAVAAETLHAARPRRARRVARPRRSSHCGWNLPVPLEAQVGVQCAQAAHVSERTEDGLGPPAYRPLQV